MAIDRSFTMRPIGTVRSTRSEVIDDDWDAIPTQIELDPERFGTEAVAGLDSFSHIEVIYVFDRVDDEQVVVGARRPRGRADWPLVGIFAQRGKNRPNKIGVTVCRLDRVEGITLHVTGLDAIDATPVLDIKPYLAGFAPRGEVVEPAWAAEIMVDYW
jgi:tRNA-Thr(GGU) m(6)t(6)A37 methyltransferase TsaA